MPRRKLTNLERSKLRKVDSFDYPKAQKTLKKYGWKLAAKTAGQKRKLKSFYKTKAAYLSLLQKDRTVSPIIGINKRRKGKGRIKAGKTSKLTYRFKFQKLTKAQIKQAEASGMFSSNQFSPKGVFIERPTGIAPKDFKVSFRRDGEVSITSDCRHDEILSLDPAKLALDPEAAIKDAIDNRKCRDSRGQLRKPKTYSLMVNGFRAQNTSSLSLKSFLYYMTNDLLRRWMDGDEDEEKFSDVFHIRLIY